MPKIRILFWVNLKLWHALVIYSPSIGPEMFFPGGDGVYSRSWHFAICHNFIWGKLLKLVCLQWTES